MKKRILILSVLPMLILSLCACQRNDETEESSVLNMSDIHLADSVGVPFESFPSSQVSSEQSEPSDVSAEISGNAEAPSPESSVPVVLPDGVVRAGSGRLKYTTSVLSMSVTFPDEFCVPDKDYSPTYGIYLQNQKGTATLLLQSVADNTLTYRQMSDYLQGQYPDAKVYTTDKKEVVCKLETTDTDGNAIFIIQKIRVKSGGYNQIVLCCNADESADYTRVMNEINFA